MNPLHMVKKVPAARKSISGDRAITSFKKAKVGVISVSMKSMSFPFVAEQTGIGREMQVLGNARGNLAPIWFQMGIQIFAKNRKLIVSTQRNNDLTEIFGSSYW